MSEGVLDALGVDDGVGYGGGCPAEAAAGAHGGPVVRHADLDVWVVSRYDTVRAVLLDPETFSAAVALEPVVPPCEEARAVLADGGVRMPPLLGNNDPPDHGIQRRFLGAPFRRARIARQQPMIAEVVAATIGSLRHRDRFDLVREVTWPIPVRVLVRFLGMPDPGVATLKRWSGSRLELMAGRPSPEVQVELAHDLVAFMDHARRFVADKEGALADDYTSELLRAAPAEGRDPELVREQICVNLFNLLAAGHETTTHLMSNAVRRLLALPHQWRALAADPSLAAGMVDELIRSESPIRGWRRRTTTDVVLDGVTIPAGSTLVLALAAANRDADRFPEPDVFDPARPNAADHLSFGLGIHWCLGAHLARLELTELLARLPAAFPHLAPADDEPPSWLPNLLIRGTDRLLVVPAGRPHDGGRRPASGATGKATQVAASNSPGGPAT